MVLDLREEVQKSTDMKLLSLILQGLAGQKCLGARLSYADELQLHFGEQQQARHPKLAKIIRGSWVLTTRASSWRAWLPRPGFVLTSGMSWERPEGPINQVSSTDLAALVNSKLSGVEVRFVDVGWWQPSSPVPPALLLGFADGSRFELVPDPENMMDRDDLIADWELFTPYKTVLRVGPGPVWSFLRSDKAQSGQVEKATG